jgi:murein L,D-transpeptidase YcbB/YkuD
VKGDVVRHSQFNGIRNLASALFVCALVLAATACSSDEERSIERAARRAVRSLTTAEDADSLVRQFYNARDNTLRWVAANGPTNDGRRLIEAIGTAEQDGLDPAAYGLAEAEAAMEHVRDGARSTRQRARALAEADVALTTGYAELLHDLRTGANAPSDVQPGWRIAQDRDLAGAPDQLSEGADALEAVEHARPAAQEYQRLSTLLAQLLWFHERGPWTRVPTESGLRAGDREPAVAALRARLLASDFEGERSDASRGLRDNARFDEHLVRAVRSFQERHGLPAKGVVDRATLKALNAPLEQRITAVRLNLERWRWMPQKLGEHSVLVNLAGFELQVFSRDAVVLAMRTVVGKPDRKTPIFSDTMTHLIVHPYWNVPQSILEEELVPRAVDDESYLTVRNYEVLDADGTVVDARAVDWSSLDPEDVPFAVRQRPGEGNALGQVKFMFPNHQDVYLHDTPEKYLFAGHMRAFSHGCVRVERPLELARQLLQWTGVDSTAFSEALEGDEEDKRIDLGRGIPVYLAYFTVRVAADGRASFFSDLYALDHQMSSRLDATVDSRQAAL